MKRHLTKILYVEIKLLHNWTRVIEYLIESIELTSSDAQNVRYFKGIC